MEERNKRLVPTNIRTKLVNEREKKVDAAVKRSVGRTESTGTRGTPMLAILCTFISG